MLYHLATYIWLDTKNKILIVKLIIKNVSVSSHYFESGSL